MKYKTFRRQHPIKGGRIQLPSCVEKRIHHAAENEAIRYGVSKSWIIATILADAFQIDLDKKDRYYIKPEYIKKNGDKSV